MLPRVGDHCSHGLELGPATVAAGTDIILARRALAEADVDTSRRFSLAVFFDPAEALASLAFLPTDERRCARNMVDCSEPETRFAAAYRLVACGRRPGVRCSWAVTVRRAPTWLAISAETGRKPKGRTRTVAFETLGQAKSFTQEVSGLRRGKRRRIPSPFSGYRGSGQSGPAEECQVAIGGDRRQRRRGHGSGCRSQRASRNGHR
jgi:hypothetical protein